MSWLIIGRLPARRHCPRCEVEEVSTQFGCWNCGHPTSESALPERLTVNREPTNWGHVIKRGPDIPEDGMSREREGGAA